MAARARVAATNVASSQPFHAAEHDNSVSISAFYTALRLHAREVPALATIRVQCPVHLIATATHAGDLVVTDGGDSSQRAATTAATP